MDVRYEGPGEMFALAGVWRHWYSPNGKSQMDSFAVITTEPNELLIEKTGHDRMPAIIKRQDYQRWLEPGDPSLSRPSISSGPSIPDMMKAWRVDRRLNNVRNNEASLCDPVEEDMPTEKPKPAKKPKSKPRADESGQLGMF